MDRQTLSFKALGISLLTLRYKFVATWNKFRSMDGSIKIEMKFTSLRTSLHCENERTKIDVGFTSFEAKLATEVPLRPSILKDKVEKSIPGLSERLTRFVFYISPRPSTRWWGMTQFGLTLMIYFANSVSKAWPKEEYFSSITEYTTICIIISVRGIDNQGIWQRDIRPPSSAPLSFGSDKMAEKCGKTGVVNEA